MLAVNLIPKSRLEVDVRQMRVRRWIGICGAYAAFLVLTFIVFRLVETGDQRKVRDQLEIANSLVSGGRNTVSTLRTGLAELTLQRQRNLAVGVQPDWSLVLAQLARTLGDEIVLRRCRIGTDVQTPSQGMPGSVAVRRQGARQAQPQKQEESLQLVVSGLARSQAAFARFLLRLEETGMFSQVKPNDTQREPFGEGYAVAFRIECVLNTDRNALDEEPPS